MQDYGNRTPNPPIMRVNGHLRGRDISDLAERRYRDTNKGLTSEYVLQARYAASKKKSRDKLKYYVRKGVLFTLGRTKPQQYFPTSMQSEIVKARQCTPVEHKGVGGQDNDHSTVGFGKGIEGHDMDGQTHDMLVGSILYMLPKLPFFIHKMNFRTSVEPELYEQLDLSAAKGNKAKCWESRIGSFRANYCLYPDGTLMIYTETSDRPFRMKTESDLYELMAFVGEIRRCITLRLNDLHGRSIPRTTDWYITQCDINRDIPVDHAFHSIGLNVRFPYLGRIFHIYIKSMGRDTVARVEEEQAPNEIFFRFLAKWFDPEWVAKHRKDGEGAASGLSSHQSNHIVSDS